MERFTPLFALLAGCQGLDLQLMSFETSDSIDGEIELRFKLDTREGEPVPVEEEPEIVLLEDGRALSESESYLEILPADEAFQIDALLLMDMSGSVANDEHLPELIEAARQFVGAVEESTTEIAVAVFDGSPEIDLLQDFTPSSDRLYDAIGGLAAYTPRDYSTNLYGAVAGGLERLDARREDHGDHYGSMLVVFTDGTHRAGTGSRWSDYPWSRREVLRELEKCDHDVFTIGVGNEIDVDELSAFGESGFELASSYESLAETFIEVARGVEAEAHSYYAITYCSPLRSGRNRLEIEVTWDGLYGDARTEKFRADSSWSACLASRQ